jgi:hypothetical protein
MGDEEKARNTLPSTVGGLLFDSIVLIQWHMHLSMYRERRCSMSLQRFQPWDIEESWYTPVVSTNYVRSFEKLEPCHCIRRYGGVRDSSGRAYGMPVLCSKWSGLCVG